MNLPELDRLADLYGRLEGEGKRPFLMVGYNRRFSPLSRLLKEVFSKVQKPLTMMYRVNAGPPSNEWIEDREGGESSVRFAISLIS